MGHQAQMKDLRKQLRNVVKEVLPEVLHGELFRELEKQNKTELNGMFGLIQDSLKRIETRSKQSEAFLMRQVAMASSARIDTPVDPTASVTSPTGELMVSEETQAAWNEAIRASQEPISTQQPAVPVENSIHE